MENIKITGATLLSAYEAVELPPHLGSYPDWWWLQSPGRDRRTAVCVTSDGAVYYYGSSVNYNNDCVRPALKICNLESSNLKVGDRFEFGDVNFEIISDDLAFCVSDIGRCAFREDFKAVDANDYEQSDIKKYVDAWYENNKSKDITERVHHCNISEDAKT